MELTSTRRVALHRYTFPAWSDQPRIVVDITNDGQQSSTNPVMTIDPTSGRVVGESSNKLVGVIFLTKKRRRSGVRCLIRARALLGIHMRRLQGRWLQLYIPNGIWILAWKLPGALHDKSSAGLLR